MQKTIEDYCEIIKAQNKLLAKHIGNDAHLFVSTLDDCVDKILKLHQEEIRENNKSTCENLIFIKPFRKEKVIVDHFGLNFMFKNDRTVFYESDDMRFCFDRKVIRVLLFDTQNKELKKRVQEYFYEKQWRKKNNV